MFTSTRIITECRARAPHVARIVLVGFLALTGGGGLALSLGMAAQPRVRQPANTAPVRPTRSTAAQSQRPAPPAVGPATEGAPSASGQAAQPSGAPQAGPDARRRAGVYRLYYGRYGRGGGNGGSQYSNSAMQPHAAAVPPNPTSVRATHNYDGSVTVTWYVPAGHGALGDVYQIGRRLPGQNDFWKVGETTTPSFTDRAIPRGTRNVQYKVVIRRNNVYGRVSPLASVSLSHAWAQRAPVVLPPAPQTPAGAAQPAPSAVTPDRDASKPPKEQVAPKPDPNTKPVPKTPAPTKRPAVPPSDPKMDPESPR